MRGFCRYFDLFTSFHAKHIKFTPQGNCATGKLYVQTLCTAIRCLHQELWQQKCNLRARTHSTKNGIENVDEDKKLYCVKTMSICAMKRFSECTSSCTLSRKQHRFIRANRFENFTFFRITNSITLTSPTMDATLCGAGLMHFIFLAAVYLAIDTFKMEWNAFILTINPKNTLIHMQFNEIQLHFKKILSKIRADSH